MSALVNHVPRCDARDVDRAVRAAHAAQPAWAATPAAGRAAFLRRIGELFAERGEELAQTITDEVAKTITDAREEVFEHAAPAYRHAAAELLDASPAPLGAAPLPGDAVPLRRRGVIGMLTSHSFPAGIPSIAIAHALAAGEAVVWKPSRHAPASGLLVGELFAEAGLPDGVVSVLPGGEDVGIAIAEHRATATLVLDGAPAAGEPCWPAGLGRELERLARSRPRVVLLDADLDAAADCAARECFHSAGQARTSVQPIFVHERVHDAFAAKLRERAAALRIGAPGDARTQLGPLRDAATRACVIDDVDDAWTRGATVDQYGSDDALFYPATVLTGVTPDMRVVRSRTPGPIAALARLDSLDRLRA
ncbi:aldehyde dehydrogenase family protein [Conexibacter woesei]|uniref:Aldehyde Dehydrogenase n=1 Tax=Conexibacter woesei (strain DSM 14684 / CCUG 47730 / CIP 108061 / JCM 11494 / NBRC 100937 / ID131577) TaxID=469383 RepID=D3F3Q0_CONWI|nr:aldehyde dehydrogenase family protein [Conexibacter woesei]ADB52415.1 Aldehyde Dehydrogenase [Conexibacter woesei DSM 14684]